MYRDVNSNSQTPAASTPSSGEMFSSLPSPKAYRYNFPTRPVAHPEAIVGGKDCKYRFTVLNPRVIRYEYAEDGKFEDRASTFAINRQFNEVPKYRVTDKLENLEITTGSITLHYDKKAFSASGLTADITGKFSRHGALWRYGVQTRDLGGTARTLDEANGRIPLESGVCSRDGYATIDDSKSMVFDSNSWLTSRGSSKDLAEKIDGYLFAFGNDFRAAVKAFYSISGRQPLLPRWALGNWWSRYYAYSADEYLKLMHRFRNEDLPFSVGVLDMDWHLVNDERVKGSGWTGYTWNRHLFPDPEGFLEEMHSMAVKVTLNDHPAGGVRSFEDQYEDMAKAMGHDTTHGDPIVFDISNKKYCDAYFDVLLASLEEQGVDFWWVDWQQGPYSRTPGVDPLWMLNHYHYLDNKRGEKRPLAFSRFAGPGSHRYPIGFSGDTHVTWDSLNFQPEFTATASNIGFGWWSHDIGGHYFGVHDEELATRWLQLGVFSPILRLHSSDNPFITKEPWKFSPEVQSIMNDFLRLRHRLLPYLYSMNVRSAQHSEPLVQPLYWHFPDISAAYEHPNEYFFGSELLVAPITSPGDPVTRMGHAKAWIPKGKHVDIFTGATYTGNRTLTLYRPLSHPPVLAKEGSIIPLDGELKPSNTCSNPSFYQILLVPGADGHFEIFEDDDSSASLEETQFSKISITYTHATGDVHFRQENPNPNPDPKHGRAEKRGWNLTLLGIHLPLSTSIAITCGKESIHVQKPKHHDTAFCTVLRIPEMPDPTSNSAFQDFTIHLPPNLSLAPSKNDVKRFLRPVLDRAYLPNGQKLAIWEVIEDENKTTGVKVGELSAMGLGEDMLGALVEGLVGGE